MQRQDAGCHLEAARAVGNSGITLVISFLTGLGLATEPECRANGLKVNSGKPSMRKGRVEQEERMNRN